VQNRLALNRLGPQKGSAGPAMRSSAPPNGLAGDVSQNRLTAKKLAEEKARARTVARAHAVAEKLSAATEQVSSAITQATGAVEEMEKTMHTIAAGAEESSAAAEESRAAINQIEKASAVANNNAEVSRQTVTESKALAKSTTLDIQTLIQGVADTASANMESAKKISELERQPAGGSRAEMRSLIESGVMRPPAKYRVVLMLVELEQLPVQEAAFVLGPGTPAIKARLL